jgi:hypothetical protein
MSNCIVCLESFKFPAALPCGAYIIYPQSPFSDQPPQGHVFCHDCIRSLVNSAQPFTTSHPCPTCRKPYSTGMNRARAQLSLTRHRPEIANALATIDPMFVPEQLRPFVTPAIRQLYVETPGPSPPKAPPPPSGPPSTASSPTASHFPTNSVVPSLQPRPYYSHPGYVYPNLAAFARVARDQALRMRAERDEFEKKYNGLKCKYGVLKRRYEEARA